jgi:uncharacterized protein (DUF342 family)
MAIHKAVLFTVVVCAHLAGCATTPEQCDPRSGGFFGALSCSTSGAYQQRIEQKQSGLAAEYQNDKTLGVARSQLTSERTREQYEIERQRQELIKLQQRLNAVTRKIEQLRAAAPTDEQLLSLENQVARLKAETEKLETQNANGKLYREQLEA